MTGARKAWCFATCATDCVTCQIKGLGKCDANGSKVEGVESSGQGKRFLP